MKRTKMSSCKSESSSSKSSCKKSSSSSEEELECAKVCETYNVGVTPAGLAITPDGKHAYVANNNNYTIAGQDSVTVLDLCKGVPKKTIFDSSFNQPYTVTINHCGNKAYVSNSASATSATTQGTVTIIDICTNSVSGTITGFDGPSGVALSKCKAYVNNYGAANGVGSGNGRTVSVVDLKTNQIISTISVGLAPAALVLSRCHKFLYVINYVDGNPGTGTLVVVRTKDESIVATIPGFSGPFAIALSPCEKYAYVTNFGSNNFAPFGTTVSVVHLKKKKIVKNITVGIQPSGVGVSPNGEFVFVSNYNTLYASPNFKDLTPGQGTVTIIKTKCNKVIAPTIPVGQSPSALAISPDGCRLYVSNFISNTVQTICLS